MSNWCTTEIIAENFATESEAKDFANNLIYTGDKGNTQVTFEKLVPFPKEYYTIAKSPYSIHMTKKLFGYGDNGEDLLDSKYIVVASNVWSNPFTEREVKLMGLDGNATIRDIRDWMVANDKYCEYTDIRPNEELNDETTLTLLKDKAYMIVRQFNHTLPLYEKYGYWDWFSYCTANWGTKWDGRYIHHSINKNDTDGTYTSIISFETPWVSPVPILAKLHEVTNKDFRGFASDDNNFSYDYWFENGTYNTKDVPINQGDE